MRIFVLIGNPDYDDSQWIDSIHDSAALCASRILEGYTDKGNRRTGMNALFPHGWNVEVYERNPATGRWEQEEKTNNVRVGYFVPPSAAAVYEIVQDAVWARRAKRPEEVEL
jgi:hypothetical protein